MTTYADLKTAIIQDSHRTDLADLVPRFIREGEGMIRREMAAWIVETTLTESDRSPNDPNEYILPAFVLIIRRLIAQGQQGPGLRRIDVNTITQYSGSGRLAQYAETGTRTVIFRGTPPQDTIFELDYMGMPDPLVNDTDTNSLLDFNETLYKSAALFYLYQNTQDRELASDQLDVFNGVVNTLNEETARKIGGAQITASYNFGGGGGY
jgi:hypothetical protein